MRKCLILFLITIAAIGAHAGEALPVDGEPQVAAAQTPYAEALVTIAPVPMPAAVVELARYSPERTSLKQAKRVKAAKVARAKSMLSRSAREQIALARADVKPDGRVRISASENEDAESGIDALDLHRSFSQPKVAKGPEQADEDDGASADDLPEHVKLRLLMARTKAVESYILSQAGKAAAADDELSESVKLRLFIARARAVKAHSEKYGAA